MLLCPFRLAHNSCMFWHFFFSVFLCFNLGNFCWPLFKFTDSFLSCADSPLNLFSIFDTVFSISHISIWVFQIDFSSLLKFYLFTLSIFTTRHFDINHSYFKCPVWYSVSFLSLALVITLPCGLFPLAFFPPLKFLHRRDRGNLNSPLKMNTPLLLGHSCGELRQSSQSLTGVGSYCCCGYL